MAFIAQALGNRPIHTPTAKHTAETLPANQGHSGNRHHTMRQEIVIMLQANHLAFFGTAR